MVLRLFFLFLCFHLSLFSQEDSLSSLFPDSGDGEYYIQLLFQVFSEEGSQLEISQGKLLVLQSDIFPQQMEIPFEEWAQSILDFPREQWYRLIAESYENFKADYQLKEILDHAMEDFHLVRENLYPKIFSANHIPLREKGYLVQYPLCPGLEVYLMVKTPFAIRPVLREEVSEWGVDDDELFQYAQDNLFRSFHFRAEEFSLGERLTFYYLNTREEGFSPSYILNIEKEFQGSHGTVIGIPNRAGILLFPLDESQDLEVFLRDMVAPMLSMYNQRQGAISPHLFWYQQGRFQVIPLIEDNGSYFYQYPEMHF